MAEKAVSELSTVEAELYDRQIRLWGIESQEKLRAANVLLIGMRGLGSEIAKNILLSGINSLTILDAGVVTHKELSTNFLLGADSIGKKIAEAVIPKAQALNPLVKITADTEDLALKNENFLKRFTIIVATGLKTDELISIDFLCRNFGVQFISGDVFGMFGFCLADFLEHKYFEDKVTLYGSSKRSYEGEPVPNERSVVRVERKAIFPSFEEVLLKSEDKIKEAGGETKRRRNPLYYLMRILIKFRDHVKRDPDIENKEEDLKKLMEFRSEVIDFYRIPDQKIPVDSLQLVFGEVAPICAVMGGVLAQEVIKAVSHNEVPIYNVFLLDPQTYGGKVEHVCAA